MSYHLESYLHYPSLSNPEYPLQIQIIELLNASRTEEANQILKKLTGDHFKFRFQVSKILEMTKNGDLGFHTWCIFYD